MATDFSSIDSLVEFGMGMALANQMVNTMNMTMNRMQIPGINAGVNADLTRAGAQLPQDAPRWYVAIDDRQAGPLSNNEMEALIDKRLLTERTLMWRAGMPAWRMARDVPEVNKLFLLHC